jgi:hypothetical protein
VVFTPNNKNPWFYGFLLQMGNINPAPMLLQVFGDQAPVAAVWLVFTA